MKERHTEHLAWAYDTVEPVEDRADSWVSCLLNRLQRRFGVEHRPNSGLVRDSRAETRDAQVFEVDTKFAVHDISSLVAPARGDV